MTLCVNNRLCLFGEVIAGEMKLNDAGKQVDEIWRQIPAYYPAVDVDEHVVMPNHIHGIIILKNDHVGAPHCGRPFSIDDRQVKGQAQRPALTAMRLSLGDVVGRFESFTMHKYIEGVKNHEWPPFYKRLWQRNYYEHIVRNEKELKAIRTYIANNPKNWQSDIDNPQNLKDKK